MGILKNCYACGAPIVFENSETVKDCDYCSRVNTLPESECRSSAESGCMRRANELRNHGEYEDATRLYQRILAENPDEHEARWGLLLCKYGVQYVEDPRTKRRFATCSMVRTTSFCAEHEFREACRLAPGEVRAAYESDGAYIDSAQAEIRRLSENEAAFDVFLCYKETAEDNSRTSDSVLAQDLYLTLKSRGYNVFYAPVSLAGKAGYNYEAAIYHAIATAKVMLVLGTKPEYLTSTWVASEWGRFLERMDAGERKVLVPLYKDMSPEQLPEAFLARRLQAVNMGIFSFMFTLEGTLAQVFQAETEIEAATRSESVSEVQKAKVDYIRMKCSKEKGEFFPDGEYTDTLDMSKYNYALFHLRMLNKREEQYSLHVTYTIRNAENEIVREYDRMWKIDPDDRKLSMQWDLCDRGGVRCAPGIYDAEFHVEGNEPIHVRFMLSEHGRFVQKKIRRLSTVQFVPAESDNTLWPNAACQEEINMRQYAFAMVQMMLDSTYGEEGTLMLLYTIRDEKGNVVRSKNDSFDMKATYIRIAFELPLRNGDNPAFAAGRYSIELQLEGFESYTAYLTLSDSRAEGLHAPDAWLVRPVDSTVPSIRNIQFITTNTLNDLWPTAIYSKNVDMDKYEFLDFHVFMNRRLGRAQKVEVCYIIRNVRGEDVFSYTVSVQGMSNSDRYSTQLYIRKNGIPAFEPGDYTVVFRIADCAPFSAAFKLTSKKYNKTMGRTDEPTGFRGLLKKLF